MIHEFFGNLLSVVDCPCGGCALITIETSIKWRSFFATAAIGADARAMMAARPVVVVLSFDDETQQATGIRKMFDAESTAA